MSRRWLLAGIAGGTALNLPGMPRSRAAQQGDPVKIGFV